MIPEEYRALMERAGVLLAAGQPAPTESETAAAESFGLTVEEARFARRLNVSPARYAASKSIRSLEDFEAEMRRRHEEGEGDR